MLVIICNASICLQCLQSLYLLAMHVICLQAPNSLLSQKIKPNPNPKKEGEKVLPVSGKATGGTRWPLPAAGWPSTRGEPPASALPWLYRPVVSFSKPIPSFLSHSEIARHLQHAGSEDTLLEHNLAELARAAARAGRALPSCRQRGSPPSRRSGLPVLRQTPAVRLQHR